MTNIPGFPGDSNFPNLPEQVAANNSQVDTTEISAALTDAQDVLANVTADIGVACAECLADMIGVRDECLKCINGQLDEDLATYQKLIDKLNAAIIKPIEQAVEDAIRIGAQAGIPITDMIVVTAPPEAFPQNADDGTPPPPAIPVATPTNTNVFATATTTTPPANTTPIPPRAPTTTQPPSVPDIVRAFAFLPPNFTPYIGIGGEPNWVRYGDGSVYTYGTIDGDSGSCFLTPLPDGTYNATCSKEIAGKNNQPETIPTQTQAGPPVECPPCAPTATAGSLDLPKQPSHPFCDPSKLKVPGVTQPTISTSEFRAQLPRPISRIADTIAEATVGTARSQLEATLLGAAALPFVAGGFAIDSLVNGLVTIAGTAGNIIGEGINAVVGGLVGLVSPVLSSAACNSKEFAAFASLNAIPSFLSFFGGMIPSNVTQPNVYAMNYLCPVLIPTGPELNSLRARGIITDSQWHVGIRANNLCPDWQELIVDGLQQVPSLGEIQSAWRRGLIDDDTYDYYMHRQGVKNQSDAEVFFRLSEYIPGPSDLVRFMLRDVFDKTVVDDQDLSSEFPQKFQGEVEEWAYAQGLDRDTMLKYWQSHWVYPSNTQLYEMLHRLRQDTPVPNSKETAKAVTTDEVLKVLGINDISPKWRARLAAISYRPLTRVDVRRAFELGQINRDEVKDSYLDQGYDETNAERLTKFAEADSLPKQAKRKGNAGATEVLKWYRSSFINRETAETFLRQAGIPADYISRYLETEDNRRIADNKRLALASLKKRFMSGEFTLSGTSSQLIDAGIDPDQVIDLITSWVRLRDAKYKAPTVSMLCDWFRRGLIEMSEYTQRVENLGYSHLDAQRIVQTCLGKRNEEIEKQAEKAAKEAESRERRRLAALKAAQRDAEKAYKAGLPCTPPKKPTCPVPSSSRNGSSSPQPTG